MKTPSLTPSRAEHLVLAIGERLGDSPAFQGASPETLKAEHEGTIYLLDHETGQFEAYTDDGEAFYYADCDEVNNTWLER